MADIKFTDSQKRAIDFDSGNQLPEAERPQFLPKRYHS